MSKFLAGNNPANDPDQKPVKGRSVFKPNRSFYQSMPFGLNVPHFAMEAVEGDKISVRVASDVDTYSLKAPLLTPVRMNKDYFFAPLRAVLPENAELIITNPLSGEDVDATRANSVVSESDFHNMLDFVMTNRVLPSLDAAQSGNFTYRMLHVLNAFINMVYFVEPFASYGSLLTHLGHSVGSSIVVPYGLIGDGSVTAYTDEQVYFDEFEEALISYLKQHVRRFTCDVYSLPTSGSTAVKTGTFVVAMDLDSTRTTGKVVSFSRFLEELRQGVMIHTVYDLVVDDPTLTDVRIPWKVVDGEQTYFLVGHNSTQFEIQYPSSGEDYLNFGRCAAYQLACAQFYSMDSVDYVYSTNLWHSNQRSLAAYAAGVPGTWPVSFHFVLNGISHQYDSVSGAVLAYLWSSSVLRAQPSTFARPAVDSTASLKGQPLGVSVGSPFIREVGYLGYINNLFGFTRSLKYRDYFAGSKTSPMAVGNVNVAVTSGEFSVVDVTKNIQIQRFLNQVNRVGRKFREYVSGIFGVTPAPDMHDCVFLGSTEDMIGAEETSNTGAAQLEQPQTTTSKLRKNSSHFAFEGQFAEPGYMIGITHFDVARPYVDSTDRCMTHVDRFDMFNPFMQQIGDQEVYGKELALWNRVPFGYQLRYSEYKQSFDRCAGAFASFLPGYAFLVDRSTIYPTGSANLTTLHISPDFIRSRSSEFDRFYISLTHNSLAGYFHFIIRHDIEVNASRAMEAAPSIL